MDWGEIYRICVGSVIIFCAGAGGYLRWKMSKQMPWPYRRMAHAWAVALVLTAFAIGLGQYRAIHTGLPTNYVTHALAAAALMMVVSLFETIRSLPHFAQVEHAEEWAEEEGLSDQSGRVQP